LAQYHYQLRISGFDSVGLTDPFKQDYLSGVSFSSRDRDNDLHSTQHCASNDGGWWYRACSAIRPHHYYNDKHTIYINTDWHALPFMEIKIRPLNCNDHAIR